MKRKTLKKKIYQYIVIFEPDKKAGGYTAVIPALPGCVSEGDNFEEAVKNIKEAASLYIEVMKQHKEEIPIEEPEAIVAPVQITIKT